MYSEKSNHNPVEGWNPARPLIAHWRCAVYSGTGKHMLKPIIVPANNRELAREKGARQFGLLASKVVVRYISNQ